MNKEVKSKKAMVLFQIFCIAFGAFLILWYLAPFFAHKIVCFGNILGISCSIILVIFGLFLPKIHMYLLQHKTLKIVLIAVFLIGFSAVSATFMAIALSQSTECKANETVIVLGCEVRGTNPSRMLRQRIDVAYDYLSDNDGSVAVLSGGQGKGESISEAECMKRELVKKGINEKRLFLENKSTSTTENIKNSKKIIDENKLNNNVVIVTSDYHEKRAMMVSKKNSLVPSAKCAKTDFYLAGTFWLREIVALMKEFVLG